MHAGNTDSPRTRLAREEKHDGIRHESQTKRSCCGVTFLEPSAQGRRPGRRFRLPGCAASSRRLRQSAADPKTTARKCTSRRNSTRAALRCGERAAARGSEAAGSTQRRWPTIWACTPSADSHLTLPRKRLTHSRHSGLQITEHQRIFQPEHAIAKPSKHAVPARIGSLAPTMRTTIHFHHQAPRRREEVRNEATGERYLPPERNAKLLGLQPGPQRRLTARHPVTHRMSAFGAEPGRHAGPRWTAREPAHRMSEEQLIGQIARYEASSANNAYALGLCLRELSQPKRYRDELATFPEDELKKLGGPAKSYALIRLAKRQGANPDPPFLSPNARVAGVAVSKASVRDINRASSAARCWWGCAAVWAGVISAPKSSAPPPPSWIGCSVRFGS
jgi:hypothetical protein